MRFLWFLLLAPIFCHGQREDCGMQSPVNIVPSATGEGSHTVIAHYQTSKEHVANLGHTVEVDYDSGSYLTFDGVDYDFRQFHFHTPSEHTLADKQFPLEMHVVHTYHKKDGKAPQYLVIGALFEEGPQSHFLSTFLSAIPQKEGEVFDSEQVHIDATEMIPEDLHGFYNYQGSLTTPPYTESVNWIILKEIKTASFEQIETFHKIEGDNARHVQALYNRKIQSVD